MQDIKKWELKMQEKVKATTWREFVKGICSWSPYVLYRNGGLISRIPETKRINKVVKMLELENNKENMKNFDMNFGTGFFESYKELIQSIDMPNLYSFGGNENADYGDCISYSKNIYLSFSVIKGCENVLYSSNVKMFYTVLMGKMNQKISLIV